MKDWEGIAIVGGWIRMKIELQVRHPPHPNPRQVKTAQYPTFSAVYNMANEQYL